ncbi:MAG: pyridoxal phosphate-dependent aminotransferase [Phycisphaerales bacterium]
MSRSQTTSTNSQPLRLGQRASVIDASGIRRVFELGATLTDPCNFSIGQPDFPVPDRIKQAAHRAIDENHNGYTLSQGIAPLRKRIAQRLNAEFPSRSFNHDRDVLITAGTSGGMLLALQAMIDPGDEVIIADPWFVIYPALTKLVGGVPVLLDTYPDGRMTAERIQPLLSGRTRVVMVNSPGNPSGVVLSQQEMNDIADLCDARGVLLVTDEIYDEFTYADARENGRCPSPAGRNQRVLLIRGFGKTYGCTGWRLGYAAGPPELIDVMTRLQQYTFVCAPSMAQHGVTEAFDVDMSQQVAAYQRKRDMVFATLSPHANILPAGGAFYAFVEVPAKLGMSATEFCNRAVEKNVLIIPGNVFSSRDTHFRLSYAVNDDMLTRGLAILRDMLRGRG